MNPNLKHPDQSQAKHDDGKKFPPDCDDVSNVEFVVVDSLQQLINSGWDLDQALELITLQNNPEDGSVKPSVASSRTERKTAGEGLINELGIVDSLDALLRESEALEKNLEENKKRISGFTSLAPPEEPTEGTVEPESPAEDSAERINFFSASFLANWTNELSTFLDCGVAIAVLSSRRKVSNVQYAGWDSAPFRVHSDLLTSSSRLLASQNEIFQSASLYASNEAGKSVAKKSNDNRDPRNSVCVLLNRLSKNVGHELLSVSQKLNNSKGRVVLFMDAASIDAPKLEELLAKPEWKTRIQELDAWFLIRRFQWSVRINAAFEWICAHPRSLLGIVALILAILFIPVPYRPNRTCVIEPESRQHIVSPVAGKIANCEVRPGDIVEKGQVLARLDDEQILRDLAAAEADYHGAKKKLESAMANRQQGEASMAKIEILKAESLVDSLSSQLRELEIKSTSSGMVIQGDWKRCLGMPVTMGQNLFEIAELTSLMAEVHLNAEDLGQIHVGDKVSVRSDSAGTERFTGIINRIEPRASVTDEGVFFVADVLIQDDANRLRPGMKANANIEAGWKRIGWLLFARPYRWLSNQWIW